MRKIIFAIIMTIALILGMLPAATFADDGGAANPGASEKTAYKADSESIQMVIDNLEATPDVTTSDSPVYVTFDYRFTLTASGTASYKAGDTITVKTNFTDMFVSDASFTTTVYDHGQNELGTLAYDKTNGNIVFTVSKDAENMEYHTFTGTFDSFKHFKAKNVNALTDYTVTAGIGTATPATTLFRIKILDRQLRVQSSGKGSLSDIMGTITMNEGDEVEIVAVPEDSGDPSDPYQVLSATLVRADNTTKAYGKTILPSHYNVRFRILYDDLKPGLNTLDVAFTPDPIDSSQTAWGFMDYNDVWKNVWGVDYNSYAQNDISIGGAAITNLYGSMGRRLGSNASDKSYDLSNLIIEEHIPGGAAGTIWGTRLAIEAILPNYWPIKDTSGTVTGYRPFRKEAGRIGDWSGRVYPKGSTDLISAGLIEKIQQTAGESYDRFLERIKATPLSYGVYIDPETQGTSILINLGSPGDPDAPGWKCSELWPNQLALDPVLNEINGDGNCIGGKVQAFRLWFYTDHSKVRYTTTFENKVYYSANTGAGVTIDRALRTARYTITRDNLLGQGHKSTLTVHVVDALDQAKDIAGVDVKLEKWNEDTGAWEDAKHEGRTYDGVTGADGELVLGESDGSVETGTLTPGKYRIREVSLPEHYSAKTMTVTTAPLSQGSISADGVFTVAPTDTMGFVALVTNTKAYDVFYHANGGTGELDCPNNPHPVGTKAAVLSPGDSITRANWYFTGWNTQSDGSGSWYAPGSTITMSDQDVDLYAQWMPNKGSRTTLSGVKVWNDAGNAAGFRPDINSNDGQPVALELQNLNGYEFPEGTQPPLPVWTVKDDDPNTWLYTFEGLPIFDNNGQIITWCVKETPSDDYEVSYENSGEWEDRSDCAYPGGVVRNTLKNAIITYILNGGSYNGSSADIRIVHTPGTPISVHEAPERDGFIFSGWYDNSSFSGSPVTEIPANSTKNRTFYAKWTEITITGIKLNSDNAKKEYTEGEDLDVTGLTLTVTKSDGSTETIDVTEDMVTGFDKNTLGNQILTVTYEGFTDTYEVKVIAKDDHDWEDEYTIDKAPTCTEKGSKSIHCKHCDETKDKKEIPATGHDWDKWTVIKEATEDEDGLEKRICKNVEKHVEERVIPALNHVHYLEKVEETKATCTTSGEKAHYRCKKCNLLFEDTKGDIQISEEAFIIPPLGHKEGEMTRRVVVKATCEHDGSFYEEVHCKVCGVLLKEELKTEPATGHDWGKWSVVKAATCLEPGLQERICKHDDSHTETSEIPATKHDWGEWEVTKAATEKEEGEQRRICKNNPEHEETRPIPVIGHVHQLSKVEAKPADCKNEGNIEYWICSGGDHPCGRYFADENGETEINIEDTVLKITEHKGKEAVRENEVPAGCEEEGAYDEVIYCEHCGKELSRTVVKTPATGHDWDEGVITTEPICNGHGIKTFTCKNNPLHTRTEEIPATGHDWGEWTITRPATETEEGDETRVCKHDETHIETRSIPKLEPATEEVYYFNTSGDGNEWKKGTDATSEYTFKRSVNDEETIDHFTGILVDGVAVPEIAEDGTVNYEKKSGSVIITLKPEFLETLTLGKHTLTAGFDDGSATAEFTILAKEEKKEEEKKEEKKDDGKPEEKKEEKNIPVKKYRSADTGDTANPALWLIAAGITAGIITTTAVIRVRRKKS